MSYPLLEFERTKDPTNEFITLAVRMKLDLAGCKIGLQDWSAFSRNQRQTLHDTDAESDSTVKAFKRILCDVLSQADRPPPSNLPATKLARTTQWTAPWNGIETVAPKVLDLAQRQDIRINWSKLDRFSRYVLWYLAEKNDTVRFKTALREFTHDSYDNSAGRLRMTA